jgi:hypothetical protein
MRATKSLKPSPSSDRKYIQIALIFIVLGLAAAWGFSRAGWTVHYGDAEAHLNIARRIVDSRTPGMEQLGTVWLPLPHLLMLPFVQSTALWQNGWAAAIPGLGCFILAGVMLFASAEAVYGSAAAAFCAALLFALNPNLLYLQSTPMNEPLFFAAQAAVLFFTVRFRKTQSLRDAAAAGVFAAAGALTRYEAWFFLPFVAGYFFFNAKRRRLPPTALFCLVAGSAPIFWFAYNAYYYSNALEFYNGPYAPRAIQKGLDYPGKGDWGEAIEYFGAAAKLCLAPVLAVISAAGVAACAVKRIFWPLFFLALVPVFYLLSMVYTGGTPIFVPHLSTKSYYNTRYGLCVLPVAAFAAAGLVAVVPKKVRSALAVVIVAIGVLPWLIDPRPHSWITLKETLVNHAARRAWTTQAAGYLRDRYRPGAGIMVSFGDQIGVLREAGIPLKEALHQGNGPAATAAFLRPDLFLHEEWAIAIEGDPVSEAMLALTRKGSPYVVVKRIEVKGAAPFEIYRRIRPLPKL